MPFSATTRLLYWHRGKRFCIFHRHLWIYVLLAAKLTTICRRLGDCGVTMATVRGLRPWTGRHGWGMPLRASFERRRKRTQLPACVMEPRDLVA